jgi:hypothetical protein
VAAAIADAVPSRVKDMLAAIAIPNFSKLLVNEGLPNMVLSHLSMGTVDGANLGVFADVDPNPGHVDVSIDWDGSLNPTAHVTTSGFPQAGRTTVTWDITDGATGQVILHETRTIDSGDAGSSFAIDGSQLQEFVYEPCEGLRWIRVIATATVTRGGVTSQGTGDDISYFQGAPIWTADRCGGQP